MLDRWRMMRLASSLLYAAGSLTLAQQASPSKTDRYHDLPAAWAGDWDGLRPATPDSTFPNDTPAHKETDALIKSLLTPFGKAKMEATSYDNAPGSLCDPEGWFPFINYGYGFALLASPGKITMIPVEADTEGVRRVYLRAPRPAHHAPTWNGSSTAVWEGDTLVIETVGFNALSWLGDDREPHTTELRLVERLRLLQDGRYLQVESEISDPKVLRTPYKLTRYFSRYNAGHLAEGPYRGFAEHVCNEDLSPFLQDQQTSPKAVQKPEAPHQK